MKIKIEIELEGIEDVEQLIDEIVWANWFGQHVRESTNVESSDSEQTTRPTGTGHGDTGFGDEPTQLPECGTGKAAVLPADTGNDGPTSTTFPEGQDPGDSP
jgi:hypothetical protein